MVDRLSVALALNRGQEPRRDFRLDLWPSMKVHPEQLHAFSKCACVLVEKVRCCLKEGKRQVTYIQAVVPDRTHAWRLDHVASVKI